MRLIIKAAHLDSKEFFLQIDDTCPVILLLLL